VLTGLGLMKYQIIGSGLIIGVSIIIATAMWIYFSPYRSCIRAYEQVGLKGSAVEITCAQDHR
jgi:hypothetical protein